VHERERRGDEEIRSLRKPRLSDEPRLQEKRSRSRGGGARGALEAQKPSGGSEESNRGREEGVWGFIKVRVNLGERAKNQMIQRRDSLLDREEVVAKGRGLSDDRSEKTGNLKEQSSSDNSSLTGVFKANVGRS